MAETPAFLDSHRIAARGVWAPGDADLRTWMHQVKPTSFSLWIEGAVDVLIGTPIDNTTVCSPPSLLSRARERAP